MKASLTQEELLSDQLSWLCIRPMLLAVRGMDLEAKLEMYRGLAEGQQALYLFYAYHNHAGTPEELYWFASYYVIEIRSWSGIIGSVRYFGCEEFAELLERVEEVVARKHREDGEWRSMALPSDLENDERLRAEVLTLFDQYRALSSRAIQRMNEWVLEHPDDYLGTRRFAEEG